MSGCRSDSGEPFVLVTYCSGSLVDWCATLPNGALAPSWRFECHHTVPKRRPTIIQWRVQYAIRGVQQITVSQCNALKNRGGKSWLKYTEGQRKHFKQGCTNPERQVARATIYIAVVTNICETSIWKYIHCTLPASKTLNWLVVLGNMCTFLVLKFCRSTQDVWKKECAIFGGRTTNICQSV